MAELRKLLISAVAIAALSSGCATVPITPARVAAAPVATELRDGCLSRWREAVQLSNAFLASPYRKTLPAGELRLSDDGMEFVVGTNALPVRVRCTTWGDIVVASEFVAQERADGFVVGLAPPKRDRLFDNTFFKSRAGRPLTAGGMAAMILHEITHSYYRCGTVSFTKGVSYYAEAAFMFHYRKHSMERLPFQTSDEFTRFLLAGPGGHPGQGVPRETDYSRQRGATSSE